MTWKHVPQIVLLDYTSHKRNMTIMEKIYHDLLIPPFSNSFYQTSYLVVKNIKTESFNSILLVQENTDNIVNHRKMLAQTHNMHAHILEKRGNKMELRALHNLTSFHKQLPAF